MGKLVIELIENEYWYGGVVNDGYLFPLSAQDTYKINFYENKTFNQINPIFLSNKGRFFFLNKAGIVEFDCGKIYIEAEEIEYDKVGNDLKSVHQFIANKYFGYNGVMPNEILFKNPQLCTWIELKAELTQEKILNYAEGYVKAGYKAGLFIVDYCWFNEIGNWAFDKERFPNAKYMIRKLHEYGFKVSLWCVPYVDLMQKDVELLKKNNALLTDENKEFVMAENWNGDNKSYYVLNFSNDYAKEWFLSQISNLRKEYEIDGLKLDFGDEQFLTSRDVNGNAINGYWTEVVDNKDDDFILELRSCYKNTNKKSIQRLADKAHRWGVEFVECDSFAEGGYMSYGLSAVIPNILTQGLCGYIYGCPDMVGGGIGHEEARCKKEELLVRYCQTCTIMPSWQFSLSYWNHASDKVKNCMKDCVNLRERFVDYIIELLNEGKFTGVPVIRYMEYEFPNQGFEKLVSQYMLGDKYIISPVLEKGQIKKKVYLPSGARWKNYFTGEEVSSLEIECDVDLDSLLIFERIN